MTASCKVLIKKEKDSEWHCYYFCKTMKLGPGPRKNLSRESSPPEPAQSSEPHSLFLPIRLPGRLLTYPLMWETGRHSASPHQVSTISLGPRPSLGSRWGRMHFTIKGTLPKAIQVLSGRDYLQRPAFWPLGRLVP